VFDEYVKRQTASLVILQCLEISFITSQPGIKEAFSNINLLVLKV